MASCDWKNCGYQEDGNELFTCQDGDVCGKNIYESDIMLYQTWTKGLAFLFGLIAIADIVYLHRYYKLVRHSYEIYKIPMKFKKSMILSIQKTKKSDEILGTAVSLFCAIGRVMSFGIDVYGLEGRVSDVQSTLMLRYPQWLLFGITMLQISIWHRVSSLYIVIVLNLI